MDEPRDSEIADVETPQTETERRDVPSVDMVFDRVSDRFWRMIHWTLADREGNFIPINGFDAVQMNKDYYTFSSKIMEIRRLHHLFATKDSLETVRRALKITRSAVYQKILALGLSVDDFWDRSCTADALIQQSPKVLKHLSNLIDHFAAAEKILGTVKMRKVRKHKTRHS